MGVIVADSVDGAVAALVATPGATVLAGGTDVMVEVNDGRRRVDHVIAVGRVQELHGVYIDDTDLVVGAATTYTQLLTGPVATSAPALAYAARTVGSPQIRNAGTIGGNLVTASPAGDTLPVLLALGAAVEIAGANGRRSVPIDAFFTGPKHTVLRPDELVVAVRIPIRRGPQDYLKVGVRNAMVIAVASVAIAIDLDAQRIYIGLGSVGPTPLRAPDATTWAAARAHWHDDGLALSAEDVEQFGARVADAARPIDDHRSTADYRRHAVGVLARRALRRCCS
jgi:CO/xanthine dehydrogenase FAD-binding subunit